MIKPSFAVNDPMSPQEDPAHMPSPRGAPVILNAFTLRCKANRTPVSKLRGQVLVIGSDSSAPTGLRLAAAAARLAEV